MTRVISLSDDAYEMLKSLKKEGDSFSDVVRTLAQKEKRQKFMALFGVAKDNPEFIAALRKSVAMRKNFKLREYRL